MKLTTAATCILALIGSSRFEIAAELSFSDVKFRKDGGIQLFWNSEPNTVYRLEYADEVMDGATVWKLLYDDYPSHGVTTFVMDTGAYDQVPAVRSPMQHQMRFYRVLSKGLNSGELPSISITSPSNGETLSGTVSISISGTSIYPYWTATLFVDGQELDRDDDGMFTINTCEWANGEHILFATIKAQSQLSGPSGVFPITIGRNVSSYVSVTFNNLIQSITFKERFFEPSEGQVQKVTADFAANADWVLEILDENNLAVRTASGTGASLSFEWDGTGNGGLSIPDGVFSYSISAEVNGTITPSGTGDDGGGGPPSPNGAQSMNHQIESYSAPALVFPPLPPGLDLPPADGTSQTDVAPTDLGNFQLSNQQNAKMALATPSNQTTTAPTRAPTKPVKGKAGDVGVAFFDFSTPKTFSSPPNGLPLPGNAGRVQLDAGYSAYFDTIPEGPVMAKRFLDQMGKAGWKAAFNKSGANLSIRDLKATSLGGFDIFGGVQIGLFLDHGSYGTTIDSHSHLSQSKQTYFASDNLADAANPWIALSEFGFSGNLRWMGILACNGLHEEQFQSMLAKGVFPLRQNTHLICGITTLGGITEGMGERWAKEMIGGALTNPKTIKDAWFEAGRKELTGAPNINFNVIFRVVGWEDCLNDSLKSYSPPGGDLDWRTNTVFP